MGIGPIPIPYDLKLAPPRQSVKGRIRRVWRSRKALRGLTQWIVEWGLSITAALAVLYWLSARTGSASGTYRIFTLDKAPKHALEWLSSVAGWLLVPAIIGGVAGHIISSRIESAKNLRQQELYAQQKLMHRLRPPGVIDYLGNYFHGTAPEQLFVDLWVRVAHRNDWIRAQEHWEIVIRDAMCTKQFAHLDRHECLRQAQGTMRLTLLFSSFAGSCLVCDRRRFS